MRRDRQTGWGCVSFLTIASELVPNTWSRAWIASDEI